MKILKSSFYSWLSVNPLHAFELQNFIICQKKYACLQVFSLNWSFHIPYQFMTHTLNKLYEKLISLFNDCSILLCRSYCSSFGYKKLLIIGDWIFWLEWTINTGKLIRFYFDWVLIDNSIFYYLFCRTAIN